MIGDAIYNILSTNTDVTGIVGERIYPLRAPLKDPLPLIVFQSRTTPEYVIGGVAQNITTTYVAIISDSYTIANRLATYVRNALENVRGDFPGASIFHSKVNQITEDFDEGAPETEAYIIGIEFEFKHN